MAFMVFPGKLKSKVLLRFLSRVIRHVKRKVILILDSHPVHTSRETEKWLEAHQDQIEVVFLPAYSPELNPDEMLNQDAKGNAVGRQKPRTQMEMAHNLRSFLHRRQKMFLILCVDISTRSQSAMRHSDPYCQLYCVAGSNPLDEPWE